MDYAGPTQTAQCPHPNSHDGTHPGHWAHDTKMHANESVCGATAILPSDQIDVRHNVSADPRCTWNPIASRDARFVVEQTLEIQDVPRDQHCVDLRRVCRSKTGLGFFLVV